MGYKDAVKDGIKCCGETYATSYYIINCNSCGSEMTSWSYKSGIKYTCKDCKEKKKEKAKEINTEIKEKKLENAIDRIRKQKNDMTLYEKAIETIKPLMNNAQWFQSTEEIMAALELYKCKIPFNHQVKIDKYIVDFVLPNDKIILEIDGELFHNQSTIYSERVRDKFIKNQLGDGWEIIRIPTKYLNKNIKKLAMAINGIHRMRKRLLKSYNGKLPIWTNNYTN